MNKALLLIIIFIILIVFNFRLFSNTDNFEASVTTPTHTPTSLTQSIYEPLVLTDDDKKMLNNVIDNRIDVETLDETKEHNLRFDNLMNMAEQLIQKVPKLINRFKETQQHEKVSENRI